MSRYKKGKVGLLFLILVWLILFSLLFFFRFTYLDKVLNVKGEIDIFIEANDQGTEMYTILSGEREYTKNMMILGSSVAVNFPEELNQRLEDSIDSMADAKESLGYYINVWEESDLANGFGMEVSKATTRSVITYDIVDSFYESRSSPLQGLGRCVMDASTSTGVPALVIISIAAHESGWGTSDLAGEYCPTEPPFSNPPNSYSYNLFGYKANSESKREYGSCNWKTWECLPSEPDNSLGTCANPCTGANQCYDILAEFTAYPTRCDSINDFSKRVSRTFRKAMRYRDDPKRVIYEMRSKAEGGLGYSTDPLWDDRVTAIMDEFLRQYPYSEIAAEGVTAEIPLPNLKRGRIEMVI